MILHSSYKRGGETRLEIVDPDGNDSIHTRAAILMNIIASLPYLGPHSSGLPVHDEHRPSLIIILALLQVVYSMVGCEARS